jgi:membrane-bound lytic murein transglycosylase D
MLWMPLWRSSKTQLAPWLLVGLGVCLPAVARAQAVPRELGLLTDKGARQTERSAEIGPEAGFQVVGAEAARALLEPTPARENAVETDPDLQALSAADESLFPSLLAGLEAGPTGAFFDMAPRGTASEGQLGRAVPRLNSTWLGQMAMPSFPTGIDARVLRYLSFYKDDPKGQAIVQSLARRSARYTPMLKEALAQAGLPPDIVWLSLIESAHNPTIRSRAGAAGLWQFMVPAAQQYNLVVDRWVDERLDVRRSTEAAIRFLSDLRQRFGNWELAMAAYNMGPFGLSGAIKKFNSNDYWELSRYEAGLPWETTLYVPKIVALSIVMNNAEKFGVAGSEPEEAEQVDTVQVGPGTTLAQVAYAAGVSVKAVAELNPQFLRQRVPPKVGGVGRSWVVRVPAGTGERAQRKFAPTEPVGSRGKAQAQPVAASQQAPPAPEVATVAPRQFRYPTRERLFYPVRGDETLESVALAFSVSVFELLAWNSLDESAALQSGMVLQVFVRKGVTPRLGFRREGELKVLTAGTPEFFDYHEGLKGKRRVVIASRAGESLGGIGQRYSISVGLMERINRRSRAEPLAAGEAVIVYVDKARPALAHELYAGEPVAGEELAEESEAEAPLAVGTRPAKKPEEGRQD